MGRKRRDNPMGLPKRVYFNHGAFFYAHLDGHWQHLGTDIKRAIAEGNRINSGSDHGTVAWWWNEWLVVLKRKVGLPKSQLGIAQRTFDDYSEAGTPLLAYFGAMIPHQVIGADIENYLRDHAAMGRPIRANRERAALSVFFSWLCGQKDALVVANPCKGIRRNPESKRDRYVENIELTPVLKKAPRQVADLLLLVYRTLQRPEDVIGWTRANIVVKNGKRALYNRQGKTGAEVWIEISPEIDAILANLKADKVTGMTLIHRLDGRPYSYDGLSAMLKRAQVAVKVASFGFYDMKAKGATDMYLAGIALERIQALCGHDSVKTTEIYVKSRVRDVVSSNQVAITGY